MILDGVVEGGTHIGTAGVVMDGCPSGCLNSSWLFSPAVAEIAALVRRVAISIKLVRVLILEFP